MSKFLKNLYHLAPNTAVIRSGSLYISQMIQYFKVYVSVTLYLSKNTGKVIHLTMSSQEEFRLYFLPSSTSLLTSWVTLVKESLKVL